jgi:signal transduction histidine kinase
MIAAAKPVDEAARLRALRDVEILDTPPEPTYDDLVTVATEIAGVPMALVSFVDEARQWFKARVGVEATETPRVDSFCAHAILGGGLFVVPDAREDERFFDNPLVTQAPWIRFYAGAPIRLPGGEAVGTLCILAPEPRTLTPSQGAALVALSRHVEAHLAVRASAKELSRACQLLRVTMDQRDMLVQFLAHDLRSPLTTLRANAQSLEGLSVSEEVVDMARDMLDATDTLQRMVVDMIDVGKNRNVGAMRVSAVTFAVAPLLQLVAGRSARVAADRGVHVEVVADSALQVKADPELLRRVATNLLDNALSFAPQKSNVRVEARRDGEALLIAFEDQGPGVKEEQRDAIFEPYVQVHAQGRGGHGLGLTFCRLAMHAQRGTVWVEPNEPRGARFVLRLPIA